MSSPARPGPLSLVALAPADFDGWFAELRERFAELVPAGAPGRTRRADALAALEQALPGGRPGDDTELLWVTDGDDRVGHVWLTYSGDDAVVRDVRLDDPATQAARVRHLLCRHVAPRAKRLAAWWTAGDPSHEAFVRDERFGVVSTNMALVLDTPQPQPDGIRLRPMTSAEYDSWQQAELRRYVAERTSNGEPENEALRAAEGQFLELLPDGVETEGQDMWIGEADGERVGMIWLDTRHRYAFVYSVSVDETARGRGHGRALMVAGAYAAQQTGAAGIALNVFGDNEIARRLYDSLGYVPTQGSVRLQLSPGP